MRAQGEDSFFLQHAAFAVSLNIQGILDKGKIL